MPTFNGQRVNRGSKAPAPQTWQEDQHSLAHADGFVGPRIGEVYGEGRGINSVQSPGPKGLKQNTPAFGPVFQGGNNQQAGVGGRMAHLDRVIPGEARVWQHQGTGNFVETFGDKVNDFGTTANAQGLKVKDDINLTKPGQATPSPIGNEDYTDVTDTVRKSKSYKQGRQ